MVAGPLEGADHDLIAALIKLQGPCATRLILRNGLEEASIEGSRREVQLSALRFILHIPEMKIILEAQSIVACEAAEGLVSPDLMLWGHLEGADRADLAVVLDSCDNCRQAIQLGERSHGNFNLFL